MPKTKRNTRPLQVINRPVGNPEDLKKALLSKQFEGDVTRQLSKDPAERFKQQMLDSGKLKKKTKYKLITK